MTIALPGTAGRTHAARRAGSFLLRLLTSPLLGWLGVGLFFALWQYATTTGLVTSANLPSLDRIGAAWLNAIQNQKLLSEVLVTLSRVVVGFVLAAVTGVALGFLMGLSLIGRHALEPFVELLRPLPIVAWIPLAILAVGIGFEMKVLVAFVAALFPTLLNAQAGVMAVSRTMRETAATYRLSAWSRLWEVYLPAASPSILTGLRLGLGLALVIAVVSEMIAGNDGIGFFIINSQQTFQITLIYAGIFTLGIIGYLLNYILVLVTRIFFSWADNPTEH